MFSTTGLFKSIPCPERESCSVVHCIFSHELPLKAPAPVVTAAVPNAALNEHDRKRRKLDDHPRLSRTSSPVVVASAAAPSAAARNSSYKGPSSTPSVHTSTDAARQRLQTKSLQTLRKPVTPPPLQNASNTKPGLTKQTSSVPVKPKVKETLNPRKIPYDPAGHAKRTVFLKYIYEALKRLNEELKKGSHTDKEALTLDDSELIVAALEEEEQIARGNSTVYPNVIKNRLAAYKKMRTDDWIKYVMTTLSKGKPPGTEAPKFEPLDTGLLLEQECLLLDGMITDQTPLVKHGYVPVPPTEDEMTEAKAAVAASLNYEVCDRCKSRFRVFPDRREEDGALTSNGPCVYHWGRAVYPKREKTDAIKGSRETVYGCCGEFLGTKGCAELATHVFKINDVKRLGSVLPFIYTPENANPSKASNGKVPAAVTFDCEMGYTVCGFELMRLTAATWPEGLPLIDVLVRPQGAILDFNTRFSGITPEAYNSATPYNNTTKDLDSLLPPPPPGSDGSTFAADKSGALPIVDSPAAARDLLCSYITPSTPLIGHALENDLNVVRLCHPRIIDTVVLFPHPRGLPIRYGLKMLTKQRLNRDIQMGGASGHDSLEDARASGELVRFAVKERWKTLKAEGWTVKRGELMPPLPKDVPSPDEIAAEQRVLGGGAGVKRQRIEVSGGDVSSKKQNLGDWGLVE